MKCSLLPLVFLVLSCGRPGLVKAETVHEVIQGGNITITCQFLLSGYKIRFCRNDCDKEEDILVETSKDKECNRKYCAEYEPGLFFHDTVDVSIINVISSDSGQYQCILMRFPTYGKQIFHIKAIKNVFFPTQDTAITSADLYFLLLLTLVPVILVTVVVICKKRRMHKDGENKQDSQMKECFDVSTSEPADGTYQSLSVNTRDDNQIYNSLRR